MNHIIAFIYIKKTHNTALKNKELLLENDLMILISFLEDSYQSPYLIGLRNNNKTITLSK